MIVFTDTQTYLALRPAIALAADLSIATGRSLGEELLLVIEAVRSGAYRPEDFEIFETICQFNKAAFRRSHAA